MKVLAIGDQHFHINNSIEVDEFTTNVFNHLQTTKYDAVILLGDLLHTHEKLHTIAFNKACQFIDRLRKITLTIVLVGNHDMVSCSQFMTDEHWLNPLKKWDNVVIVDKAIPIDINGCRIVCCPFVPNGRFVEALNTITDYDWKQTSCIFAHQEFYGCKMGALISTTGDHWDLSYPQIISGHIHQKQRPQQNIYYTGSSIQIAFGESKDNTIASIEIINEYVNISEVDLDLTRKKIEYVSMDNIDDYKVSDKKDIIKLTITGDVDECKAFKKTTKYKELLMQENVKIVFKPKKHEHIQHNYKVKSFHDVLYTLVCKESNETLYKLYEKILNNRDVKGDVLFINCKEV